MSEWGVTLEPGLQGLSDEARFGPDAREKGTVFLVEETRRAEAWWWGWGGVGKGRKEARNTHGLHQKLSEEGWRRPRLACSAQEFGTFSVSSSKPLKAA